MDTFPPEIYFFLVFVILTSVAQYTEVRGRGMRVGAGGGVGSKRKRGEGAVYFQEKFCNCYNCSTARTSDAKEACGEEGGWWDL